MTEQTPGPDGTPFRLAERYGAYARAMEQLVPTAQSPHDWAPLTRFVATSVFERVGTFREHQDWDEYLEMLTRWASSIDRFEAKPLRQAELGDRLYYEVEEHHFRGDRIWIVNSMSVVVFDEQARICHLSVYSQEQR